MGAQDPNLPEYQPQHLKISVPTPEPLNTSLTSLPALASLGAIAANIAGAATGKGAVGAPLVDVATGLADREQRLQRERQALKEQQASLRSLDQITGRAGAFLQSVQPHLTPAQAGLAQELIDQGEYPRAVSLVERWLDDARASARSADRDTLLPMLKDLQASANKDADEAQQAIRELDAQLRRSNVGQVEALAKDIAGLSPDVVTDDTKLQAFLERKYGKQRFTRDTMEKLVSDIQKAYQVPGLFERLLGKRLPVDEQGRFLRGVGETAAQRFREGEISEEQRQEFEALLKRRQEAQAKIDRAAAVRRQLQEFLRGRLPPELVDAFTGGGLPSAPTPEVERPPMPASWLDSKGAPLSGYEYRFHEGKWQRRKKN